LNIGIGTTDKKLSTLFNEPKAKEIFELSTFLDEFSVNLFMTKDEIKLEIR
jgi:hypothetical protein